MDFIKADNQWSSAEPLDMSDQDIISGQMCNRVKRKENTNERNHLFLQAFNNLEDKTTINYGLLAETMRSYGYKYFDANVCRLVIKQLVNTYIQVLLSCGHSIRKGRELWVHFEDLNAIESTSFFTPEVYEKVIKLRSKLTDEEVVNEEPVATQEAADLSYESVSSVSIDNPNKSTSSQSKSVNTLKNKSINDAFRKLMLKDSSDDIESECQPNVDQQTKVEETLVSSSPNVLDRLLDKNYNRKQKEFIAEDIDLRQPSNSNGEREVSSRLSQFFETLNARSNGLQSETTSATSLLMASGPQSNTQDIKKVVDSRVDRSKQSVEEVSDGQCMNRSTKSTNNISDELNQAKEAVKRSSAVNVIDKLYKYYFNEFIDEQKDEINDRNSRTKSGYFEYKDDTFDYHLILSVSQFLSSPMSRVCRETNDLFEMVCSRLKNDYNLKEVNAKQCQKRFDELFSQYIEIMETSKSPFDARKSFKYFDLFKTIDLKNYLPLEVSSDASKNHSDSAVNFESSLSNEERARPIVKNSAESMANQNQNISVSNVNEDIIDCFLTLSISHCLSAYPRQATEDPLSFWTLVADIMLNEYSYKSIDALGCRTRFVHLFKRYANILSNARTPEEAISSLKCFRIFNTMDMRPLLTPNAIERISELKMKFWNQMSSGANGNHYYRRNEIMMSSFNDNIHITSDYRENTCGQPLSMNVFDNKTAIQSREDMVDHYLCVSVGHCLAFGYKLATENLSAFWSLVSQTLAIEFEINRYGGQPLDSINCMQRFQLLFSRYVQALKLSKTMDEARNRFHCFAIIHKMDLKPLLTSDLFEQFRQIKLKFLM